MNRDAWIALVITIILAAIGLYVLLTAGVMAWG